jgi:hypothetical protein
MSNIHTEIGAIREQLEEFALHLKPGTTKGKHRTAIFDTLELAKLVQTLLLDAQAEGYKRGYKKGEMSVWSPTYAFLSEHGDILEEWEAELNKGQEND